MNGRNLLCWLVCLSGCVGLFAVGNASPIEMKRTQRSAWTRLWEQAQAMPIPVPGRAPPQELLPPPRLPPPDPSVSLTREGAEDRIWQSACRLKTDTLVPQLQVSIRVSPWPVDDESEIEKGASRMAAAPDLPAGFQWPERNGQPLGLLAQIRLEDVAPHDEQGLLPESGWLCFFYSAAKAPLVGNYPEDRTGWAVAYFDGEPSALRRVELPAGVGEAYPPCSVKVWKEWTLPSLTEHSALLNRDDSCRQFYDDLCAVLAQRPKVPGWHHLLGHSQNTWGPMRPICALASGGFALTAETDKDDPEVQAALAGRDDWVLLLQVDLSALAAAEASSRPGPSPALSRRGFFSGSDRLYYWIRGDDLRARDFSRVWAVRQGYVQEEDFDEDEEASDDDGGA